MRELWSSASYEPHLLSLAFAIAPAAMLIVITYTAVMRGAPALRGWLLAHVSCLLPYALVMMLSPSIAIAPVAAKLYQIAIAFVPLAAATGTAFQLAVIRRRHKARWLIRLLIVNALAWLVIGIATNAGIDGVRWVWGFWFPRAGRWTWVALINVVLLSAPGFLALGRAALASKPSHERRQWRFVLLANAITYAGLVDAGNAYGVGVFPIGWVLSTIGCVLVVRALIVEDLLRVRAVDTTAPLLMIHLAGATLLGWAVMIQLGTPIPWLMLATGMSLCFASVRMTVAVFSLIQQGGRSEGPLDRLLAQLVGRSRAMTDAGQIARLAIDVIELALGVRVTILLASDQDWGWSTHGGQRLEDAVAPDPLVMSWLAERRDPVFADDLELVPADLRDLFWALFSHHDARAILPIGSDDELLGVLLVPATARRLRERPLEFLARTCERVAEALLHARMARRAAERAEITREVELAATVQAELLPGRGPQVHGPEAHRVTVIGSWLPATKCAGDFWGVYPLHNDRVLIVIGDVTGHGVASAMVTAAAVGACDAFVRANQRLDLAALPLALDAAVRRVGGGELAMTCFAAILDPSERTVSYVSCGHPTPYLCSPAAKGIHLQALVARGNLLGLGAVAVPRVIQRELQPGDLLVCYTDGVVDAQNPPGAPFGDRRLQHLLRRLDVQRLAPLAVHDLVAASVAAHRAGRALADDETLVIAQVAARPQTASGVV